MSRNTETLPEWERVLSAAARLQQILPEAVLVGGTASAIHAQHRFSRDADHVLTDPLPYDLEDTELAEYKALLPQWQDWEAVKAVCAQVAVLIFDRMCETPATGHPPDKGAD